MIERIEKLIKASNRMPAEDDSKPKVGQEDVQKVHNQLKQDRQTVDKKLETLGETVKDNISKQTELCNAAIAKMMAKREALLARTGTM